VFERRELDEGETEKAGELRGSSIRMLDEGKFLPFGTRLVYAGSPPGEEDYRALEGLKRYHLTLEYLIIDERTIQETKELSSRRYQIKERGYEILSL
jgi:hypothetical protein